MGRPIPANDRSAYTRVAIALHWAIALTIIALMVFGVLMTKEWMPNRFAIYQWHKSFGITVLVLSLLRLAWRLGHPPPPLPSGMKGWEVFAAKLTHVGFYALMIGMPLLGWAMTSACLWATRLRHGLNARMRSGAISSLAYFCCMWVAR
jgi:cytochrome b561